MRMNRLALVGSLALVWSGCLLAAAGGAGGGIYFTSQGVESVVPAPVERVASATERVFSEFGLARTELQIDEDGRTLRAKPTDGSDPEVTVTIDHQGEASTKVEVTARNSLVTWDKEYARNVLEKIVEYSG
jgi:hypothetical protein